MLRIYKMCCLRGVAVVNNNLIVAGGGGTLFTTNIAK